MLTGTNGATADTFENPGRVLTAVTQPPEGQGFVTFLADGTISYTPPANYNGTTSFTYTVTSGGVTETATVTINVTAVNDAPVNTLPATVTVAEDALAPISGLSVADVDSSTLTVTLNVQHGVLSPSVVAGTVSGAETGALTITGTSAEINLVLASLRYRGNPDYNGADTLTMTTSDGIASDVDTVAITVTPVVDITDDAITTSEDTPVSFNVLTGTGGATADTFEDGARSVVAVTQPPAGQGSVSFLPNGLITYTPAANFAGTTSFTYTVSAGGVTETATVTITVVEQNDPPVTTGAINQTALDGQTIDLPLGSAFSDVDGDTLTFSATGLPQGLSIDPSTGVISGTIDSSASQVGGGVYNITVTADDGRGGLVSTSFTWTITNPAPVAENDSATVDEDASVTIPVLANDSDPDGDTLTVVEASAGNGTVTINPNGTITYTPNANFNGTDTIIYTVDDGEGGRSTATVSVAVNPINDAPTTTGLSAQNDADGDTVSIPVASAFADVDGDTLTFSADGLPPGLSIDPATGVISGTLPPDASAFGPYTVTVTAVDSSGAAVSATFVWAVQNVPPLANDDVTVTTEDTSVTVLVLANDSDPDGDPIRIISASATNGTVTINDDNSLTFTPAADFHGVAHVTYTITDDEGGFSTATLTVTVNPVNDAPVSESLIDAESADGQPVSIDVGDFFSDMDGDTLTFSADGLPDGLSINPATGVISGTIAKDASQGGAGGVYTVTVTATDPDGLTSSQTFSWTITNPAPTAVNDIIDTPEDTPVIFDPRVNDSDPDDDPLTIVTVDATNGTATINGDGTITFVPDQDFEGTATVTYTISDGNGGFSTATARINVVGENDIPVAQPDTATTNEDTSVTIPVLANDSDADGDPLTIVSATAPNGDVVYNNVDGTITYTPHPNFHGTDTITYVIEDGQGGTASATVTVTVNPVNDAPVAVNDTAITSEDAPVTLSPLVNDSDVDGDPLTITHATASNGTVVINGDGTITYTPNADFHGADTITYTIEDGQGGTSTAIVNVTVTPVNDAPTPVGTIPAHSSVEGTVVNTPVAGYFTDVDNPTLTYSATGLPAGLSIDPLTGVISGIIDRSASQIDGGVYSVVVTATDAGGLSTSQGFSWTVTNPGPVAVNDSTTTVEDTPVTIAVLANDSDPDNDPLTITAASAENGTVTINGDGTITYTPNLDFNGTDTITYTISDGQGGTATATVSVTIGDENDAPVTSGLAAKTGADNAVISGISVAGGFSDVDGDTLSYTATGLPAGLTLDPATGMISGTIASDASIGGPNNDGIYEVTVTATDPSGASVSTVFTWTVTNPAPVAVNDVATTAEDTPTTINVLANDSDPDGDPLTISDVSASNGSVIVNGDGTITYTPNANFFGTDTITYTIDDGQGGKDTATVTVTVTPVNDAPTTIGTLPSRSTPEGTSVSVQTSTHFGDVDSPTLAYSATGLPPGLSIDPSTGIISGTIDNSAAGSTGTFGYDVVITVTDEGGLTATQTFTWTVTNPGPTAANDSISTEEDTPATIDVLGNDIDPDGDTLTVIGALAGNGTVIINGNGTITYTPNADFNGTDTITYTIRDEQGATSTATVTVTVTPVNDAPTAVALPPRTDTNSETVTVPVAGAFSDVDGNTLTYSASGLPDGLSINPVTGVIEGTIASNASTGGPGNDGVYTVIVSASDGASSVSTTFAWTINNVPPVAADDAFDINEDTPTDLDVLQNDTDPDGNPLPANPIQEVSATNGTATINPDGTIRFTPDPDFNGIATITYTIEDSDGDRSSASVTITVHPVNDAPTVPIPLSPQTGSDGQTITPIPLGGFFNDVDGDTLTFSASGLPNGVSIDPATGTISGTIDPAASTVGGGIYTVEITANDGNGGSETTYFVWTIGNPAPVAVDDIATTNEDSPTTINVLGNDSDPDGDTLTVTGASATNGQVVVNSDGTIDYTPNANFNGVDTITYTIDDGQGGTSTATVTVTVNPINDSPTVSSSLGTRSGVDGATVSIPTAHGFADVDNDTLVYSASGLPAGLSIDPLTGVISGTIHNAASQIGGGVYTVSVTATDPSGMSATQSFTWSITNPAPTAVNDVAATLEDTPVTISVLDNDSDPDGDTLVITEAQASNGTVTINGDGTITYSPNADFNGVDTITYTIDDGQGGKSTATVTITVAEENDDPVAVDDVATTNEDSSVSIAVLANDSDTDGDPLTVTDATAANGSVVINGDGTITYTPNADFNGTDTITYTIDDGRGGTSTATVTVTVNPVNDTPVAVDDTATTSEDTPVTIDPLANDGDVDGDLLTITDATAGNGTVTINPDGTITYTPEPNFNGTDTITYTIDDGNGGTTTATVTVTVTPVNDAPVAADDTATTDEDTPVTIDPLANDGDVDGDPLTITDATAGNGTVTINPDGTITYAPEPNFNGTDTITYTIDDGQGGTSTATVTVTVTPVNDTPVAVDDTATTSEDTPVTIDPLANDGDVDGDPLTITDATAGNGTVTINPDGTITYTPNADFNGTDTITYTIDDGQGGTTTGTITVTVTPVNDTPVAAGDTATTNEDTPVTIDPLANDGDVDGDPLTITDATAGNGTVTINPDGTITYTPEPNFNGTDTITYTIDDGNGGTTTATVTVTVTPVNDAPVAIDDSATVDEDGDVVIPVLANDSDVDGDPLKVTDAVATNGTVTINPDGTVSYRPDPDFHGSDTIRYTVDDGNGGTAIATVTVTVVPVNDAPVAVDDTATTSEDTPVTIDPLANDGDVDGDPLTITDATAGNGTVTINPDGTITYTPNADFNGTDTITYTIDDGKGGTTTGTITVTVTPVNDTPVAAGDTATTSEDTPVTIDPLANDGDVDGDPLTITDVTAGNGTVTINPDGTITYTPNADFNGTDTITYVVDDGKGGKTTGTITVTVTPVNDTPVAAGDTATTSEDTPVTIDPLANDGDVDGDPLTITDATAGNGTVTINPDGTITYTPNADFNGTDTITYVVDDGKGGKTTATVTVTVTPVNDAPTLVDDSATVYNDRPITVAVLDNDSDADGDPLTLADATSSDGRVTVNPDGTITFVPLPGFAGVATVTYTVSDGKGGISTGTLQITVLDAGGVDTESLQRIGHIGLPTPDDYRAPQVYDRNFILAPPVVLDTVNTFSSLRGTLDLSEVDGVVVAAVNHVESLNGIDGFASDGYPVGDVVSWIARHNQLQLGAPELFDRGGINFISFAGSSLNLVANDNGMSFETLKRGETIYLEIRDDVAPDVGDVVRFELRGVDGTVPEWIQFDARGLAIIDPPAGTDTIPLTIRSVRRDGSYTETGILLGTQSGEIEIIERSQGETQAALPLDRVTRDVADRASAEAEQLLRAFGA